MKPETKLSKARKIQASKFFAVLPIDYPFPNIYPRPDGIICFDWIKNNNFALSVLVDGNRYLHYTFYGTLESTRGKIKLENEFPKVFKEILDNIYS